VDPLTGEFSLLFVFDFQKVWPPTHIFHFIFFIFLWTNRTYAEGKVKYSYSIELRDTGRYGFLLPESEILPSSEETMAGIVSLASFIRKREKQWGYLI
jgi:hypothetical protein